MGNGFLMSADTGPLLDQVWKIINKELDGVIPFDNYSEFAARRFEKSTGTQTVYRIFDTEKLSKMIVEHYAIQDKMRRLVLNIFPQTGYDIPIFTFQIGGQPPEKTLFLLDIIPVGVEKEHKQLQNICNQYLSSGINSTQKASGWVKDISSPFGLVCQYKSMDINLVIDALISYLRVWKVTYYIPAKPHQNPDTESLVTANILRFKQILMPTMPV